METTPTPALPAVSLHQRIWGIHVAPRAVFTYLKHRPHLLGALLVLALINGLGAFLVGDVTLQDQIARIESREGMTEEDRRAAIETTTKMSRGGPVIAAVFAVIGPFIVAAILLFISNVILGGSATYRQLTSATAHAFMVSIPMLLIRIPLSLAQGTAEIQTSLAAFLSPGAEKGFLYFALAQFDVFGLWILGLTVLAVSVVGTISLPSAAKGVVGAWILWSLIAVPLQTLLNRLA